MNMTVSAWARTADGRIETGDNVVAELTMADNIGVVSIRARVASALDPELGATIRIELPEVESFMADYLHSEFWCRPAFGHSLSQVPDDTQGLVCRKKDGGYLVVLPIVSEQYKCVLCGDKEGLLAKLFSWAPGLSACEAPAFLVAEGENPFELLEKCTKRGIQLLGGLTLSRDKREYPEILGYLGWCSWDALQLRVSEAGVLEKCREFTEKNIPVRWVLLDDMWAEIHTFYGAKFHSFSEMVEMMHGSPLYNFEADPYRFPQGLKHCIDEVHRRGYQVGMWHPTTGYWFGIDPAGPLFEKLKDILYKAPDGRYIPWPEYDKGVQFYKVLHEFLRDCGADFVKIDNQSITRSFYKNTRPVGQVARDEHRAIEDSVQAYFDNKLINCMGMASEDMWNRPRSDVSRCSDDFLPENRPWFTKHILQCSYNSMIQGQFITCDWDMWWTGDTQALKNSVLRAISGGPIYVSDKLWESRGEILKPLVLSDGRILRCDRPAMPAQDCVTENPEQSGKLFKVQNVCSDSGVVAVFNLDSAGRSVSGTVSPADVEGLEGDEFVLYEHFSNEWQILRRSGQAEVVLPDSDAFRLYIIVPIKNGFAPIGLIEKMISPKTILRNPDGSLTVRDHGTYAYVKNGVLYTEER